MMHYMDEQTAPLASAIGGRIRRERQVRGWTLDQLANVAGISRRSVINVEQGTANPSVGTLLRLADALGISLPALVEPPTEAPVTVTRDGDAAVLWTGDRGGRGALMTAVSSPAVVELWEWTLAEGDRHEAEPHTPGTRELVHVLDGNVLLTVAGQDLALAAGDAASFPGDVAHAYSNNASAMARFSLTVFEPVPSRTGDITQEQA
jgi:transcriptional regulator with XRE-family HTH domain